MLTLKQCSKTDEMVQWAKSIAAKPDGLSLVTNDPHGGRKELTETNVPVALPCMTHTYTLIN